MTQLNQQHPSPNQTEQNHSLRKVFLLWWIIGFGLFGGGFALYYSCEKADMCAQKIALFTQSRLNESIHGPSYSIAKWIHQVRGTLELHSCSWGAPPRLSLRFPSSTKISLCIQFTTENGHRILQSLLPYFESSSLNRLNVTLFNPIPAPLKTCISSP